MKNEEEVRNAFSQIRSNLEAYRKGARLKGSAWKRWQQEGFDMFIGGKYDASFGPVVLFGLGGVYVEVFKDIAMCMCPADEGNVHKKLASLQVLRNAPWGERDEAGRRRRICRCNCEGITPSRGIPRDQGARYQSHAAPPRRVRTVPLDARMRIEAPEG